MSQDCWIDTSTTGFSKNRPNIGKYFEILGTCGEIDGKRNVQEIGSFVSFWAPSMREVRIWPEARPATQGDTK
jgi:hypothetical protein